MHSIQAHKQALHKAYVIRDSSHLQSLLVIDLDELLQASCGVCDIEL